MDAQELRNLQEAYVDVYYELDEERAEGVKPYEPRKRNPLPKEKPLSGKKGDGSGYGGDEKFTKPDDKIEKPGTTVPAPKKGGYGRIMSNIPYGKENLNNSYDLYDIILSHLLDEGYADTQEAAQVIMVNMSEDWRESICEGYKRFPYKKVEDKIHKKEDNPTGRGTPQSIQMGKVSRHFRGGKEIPPVEKREHSPQISKAREAENRARRTQEG
ncbi:MAG: hypothetical protein EB127_15860 [Alphaproteobacteria bacterium]|nr:hypothetical protein [Alphaproteobacteria bacterium]